MDHPINPPPPCGLTWTIWKPPSPLPGPHGLCMTPGRVVYLTGATQRYCTGGPWGHGHRWRTMDSGLLILWRTLGQRTVLSYLFIDGWSYLYRKLYCLIPKRIKHFPYQSNWYIGRYESSIKSRLNKRQALEVTKKLFSDLYFFIFEHNFENK